MEDSTLKNNFNLLMFANYIITTVSHVENIVQAFGNIFTIQSSIIPMISSYILLT